MTAAIAELRALAKAMLGRLDELEKAQQGDPPRADTPREPSDKAFEAVAKIRARRRHRKA